MSEKPYVPAAGRDWLLPFYDPLTRLLGVGRFHRRLLDRAAIAPAAHVLEIGCGTGNLAILAKRLNAAADVVGIDPDPRALARARQKAQRLGLSVRFDPAYAQQLPFPDGSFDRVLSAFMLHHLPPDAKVPALREAWRVLKPGGALHLVDFDGGARSGGGLHGFLARIVHGRRGRRVPHGALALMEEAGFASAREAARYVSIMGRVVYYEAVRPPNHRAASLSRPG